MSTREEWLQHQKFEMEWWGDCVNTSDEEIKQLHYAQHMGLNEFNVYHEARRFGSKFDLRGCSVLDIGGGPVSLLLKCFNFKRAVVLDPGKWPQWIMDRYEKAGIKYLQAMAEDIELDETFDEAWIYNTLQHVWRPELIIQKAISLARTVRVFEWIETIKTKGHPHILTKEFLDQKFGADGRILNLNWRGSPTRAYCLVLNINEGKTIDPVIASYAMPLPSPASHFRFHLLGLAHVPTHRDISLCAYSQKIVKLGRMLMDLGHTVYFYGGEGSDVPCTEFIRVITNDERVACYGEYDWRKEFFAVDWGKIDPAYKLFNDNAIMEIKARMQARDFLLCTMGTHHEPIARALGWAPEAVRDIEVIEPGVGYRGVFTKRRVFESYAQMHRIYAIYGEEDGSWYDAVIPNYFDPADFPYCEEKDDYYLFIGRLVRRKGLDIAVQVTKMLGKKLIIAGQGSLINRVEGLAITDAHVDHIGSVGPEERKALMGRAKAVFVPTIYIEPFGGVAVEAQMCGTPVITTDWGAFAETVLHGVTGYRCRTFDHFLWAAANIETINPQACHEWAVQNYSLERVSKMYEEYFRSVYGLWLNPGEKRGDGHSAWYRQNPARKDLDWLERCYCPGEMHNG